MKAMASLLSERFRTTFMVFYALSSLLPILVMMYVVLQYVRPNLNPTQAEELMEPVTYALFIMVAIPILGVVLMAWWVRSLEKLTADVRAKTAEILQERVEINEKNEIVALQQGVNGLYGELKGKIAQLDVASQQLDESRKKIDQLTTLDEVTSLYNRRHYERSLVDHIQKAEKGKYELALLMIDVDEFKAYNQQHGHAEGDELLKSLGLLIKDYTRKLGIPHRYGGDEFAIILPKQGVEAAAALAQKLIQAAARVAVNPGPKGAPGSLTFSCAVVSYAKGYNGLILEADRCLREIQTAGKGSVVLLAPQNPGS